MICFICHAIATRHQLTNDKSMTHISDIKLIRTDTTLDLSQKAEKGMSCNDVKSALPQREPFQKFSKAGAKPRPKRGFGNSFQPAIDAPRHPQTKSKLSFTTISMDFCDGY
ncbi:hypothetical protein CR513_41250, partial [Mucuna pruriens]